MSAERGEPARREATLSATGSPRWTAPRGLVAVSLDATGTLFSTPRRGEIYAEVLNRHGAAVEPAACERALREAWREFSCATDPAHERFHSHAGGARGYWRRFLERVATHLDLEDGSPSPFAAAELFDRFAQAEAWEVFPDAVPALERLRALGLRLAVTSNWDERLPRLLERLGLAPFFETIVFSAEIGYEKPHPALFAVTVGHLNIAPGFLLHVGDSAKEDVEGAIGAGIHGVLLERGKPAAELPSLTVLVDALERVAR